jgi:hypothetical protein
MNRLIRSASLWRTAVLRLMPTYTFHHYGQAGGPSGITFSDCDDDAAALVEARRLLEWHGLVEVCEFRREVGAVKRADPQGQSVEDRPPLPG